MKHKKFFVRLVAMLLVLLMLPVYTAFGAQTTEATLERITAQLLDDLALSQEAPAEVAARNDDEPTDPQPEEPTAPAVPPAHVPVQPGDMRIENRSLRMDIGRLGQVTRLNIVDMDLSRPQNINSWREMNFVAGVHTFASNFRNSADHQWIGEMIFSTRSAETREGLATAGPFVEVDTNRLLQAGGRATHNSPNNDTHVNPFFTRTHNAEANSVVNVFNPDPENMPTGNEPNPAGGNLNTNMETGGVTAQRRSRIITDFQVESAFSAATDDDSILWSITITNPGEGYIEFGDIGLPMLWNARFSRPNTTGAPANNTEHVYDNSVIQHSFQGADSGFLQIIPPRGDNFLIFTPVPQTGARIEYVDHWTNPNWGVGNVHRPDMAIWRNDSGGGGAGDANNYNLHGMTVAYIHSASIRNFTGSSYFFDTDRGRTYFEDPLRFPMNYNPVAPGTGFGGGANPSSPEHTPLFTTLILGPGESQTYEFRFHAVRGGDGTPEEERGARNNLMNTQDAEINHMMEREVNMNTIMHDAGLISAVAVPSFQPAINMNTLMALRHDRDQVDINEVVIYCIHENDVFSNQHIPAWGSQAGRNRSRVNTARGGIGLHNAMPEFERSVIFRPDLSGYDERGEWISIYELNFSCIGNNSVRVYYDLLDADGEVIRPAFTQYEFNVLAQLDAATQAHANFLRTEQQFWGGNTMQYTGDNPENHPLYGIYFDYHITTGITRIAELPVAIQNSVVSTSATPTARWGDDWSNGHALFMSMANYMNPDYDNIRSLETFLVDFMWNRFMATRHESFLKPHWIATSPINGNTNTTADRFFGSAMVANTFFNMYRIQRAFPEFMEYRMDALFYLDVAAAMWDNGLRGGWGSGAGVAFYGEQQMEDIIQALHQEGRTHRLNTFRGFFANTRIAADFGAPWPFRSEFEYDNTTEEGLYARTISMLRHFPNHQVINVGGEDRALRHMQVFNWSTRAKRGIVPTWYQYGVPTFRGGESWWNFQYTTSLAGFIMDDWLRFQYDRHDWGVEDIAWANRMNYSAKISNFNHVNMGQISDRAIGATSITYTMRKGTFGTQSVQVGSSPQTHNGWHDMGMEAPLSIYGSLLAVSTDVINDPIFGPFAYGGDVVNFSETNWTVRPTDGFGRRLNFLEERVYIQSNNKIAEARFTRDSSRIEFDLINLQNSAHVANFETYGLTPGFYSILLNGEAAGQFYVNGTDRNEGGFIGVGPRALEGTAMVTIPSGENFTVAFVRAEEGTPVAPTINIVPNFAQPWAGFELPILAHILGDGADAVSSIKWTVIDQPEGAEVSFTSSTPHLTGAAHTMGRRNSVWVDVDTSLIRRAIITPSMAGEYTLQVEAQKGEFTVTEQITITVIENPNLDAPAIIEVVSVQDANFITLTAEARTFDSADREIEFEWQLVAWPANGENADITVGENATEIVSLGFGGNFINRTEAMMVIPRSGVYTLRLVATDMGRSTYHEFDIRAHGDFNIRAYSVVSQAGVAPANLPADVEVLVTGEMQRLPVNWGILDAADFMVPGSEIELTGTVVVDENTTISVVTTVFVVGDITARVNHAPAATAFATWNNPGDLGGVTVMQRLNIPTGSANYSPAGTMGAWHNWGREGVAERIEYTWSEPILLDRFDLFVMQNGAGSFRPFLDDFQIITEPLSATRVGRPMGTPTTAANQVWNNENWHTPRNLQGLETANTINQFNSVTFEPTLVYGIALYLRPGAGPSGLGVGVLRWWPQGYEMEAVEEPVDVESDRLQVLRDIAFEMNGGNREGGGSPGGTARFANWAEHGAVVNAARIAADAVLANPQSQEQVDEAAAALIEAIGRITPAAVWQQPAPAVANANNIAFQALRSGSEPSPGQGHRINNINNNTGTANWGTWGVGPLPSLNGTLAVPGGNFGVHWLQYDWPQGARIEQSNIRHWRDAFTGTGGVNTPSVLRFWYLPIDSDTWVMHTEWSRPQLVEQITNAGAQQWSRMSFEQPIYARAVRAELGRLVTGTGQGVGVSQWQIFGELLEQQDAPAGFTVVHNTEMGVNAGIINNVTSAMEWRLNDEGAWNQIAEETTALTGLANGNYFIRYKGHGATAPSPSARVDVRLQRSDRPVGLDSEPATYGHADGIITGVTTAMEFSNSPDGPFRAVTGIVITGLEEGTWYVRFAATDHYSPSLNAEVTVGRWDGAVVPHSPPTGITANPPGRPGDADGDIRGVTPAMEWRAVGAEEWTAVVGVRISGLVAGNYEVRVAATPRNSASIAVIVIVPEGLKGGQAAPAGLVGVGTSVVGTADGQILGVNETMEWATDEDGPWTAVEGNVISDLAAGTYLVRRTETETHMASPFVEVVVPASDVIILIESIEITAEENVITEDRGSLQLTAVITPSNASNRDLVWTVTPSGLATVSSTGLLTALRNGDVVVRATADDGTAVFAEIEITISGQTTPPPTLGFNIFNNGNSNNQSLANLGVIRMWTQLDGANSLIPYAHLTVTATTPDGRDAMEFVRINRIWNDLDNVNLFDVRKDNSWQTINLTATLFGQTIEVTLVNDLYIPQNFGLRAFNNGNDNNISLANLNVIRIWTQINGVSTLVPTANLNVTAIDQDGNDASQFVRVNQIWNAPENVNLIDVTKAGNWETITLTVTLNGQSVEMLLVNNHFVAETAPQAPEQAPVAPELEGESETER